MVVQVPVIMIVIIKNYYRILRNTDRSELNHTPPFKNRMLIIFWKTCNDRNVHGNASVIISGGHHDKNVLKNKQLREQVVYSTSTGILANIIAELLFLLDHNSRPR